jgi:RHS repeat-associated protein
MKTLHYFQNKGLGLLLLLTLGIFQSNAQQVTLSNVPTGLTLPALPQCAYPGLHNLYNPGKFNYVRTIIPDAPVTNITNTPSFPSTFSYRVSTDYFDGLGRPLQTVAKQAQDGRDIIQSHVYDSLGREVYQYLPLAAATSPLSIYGYLELDDSTIQRGFYDDLGHDEQPYGQTVYESSPLNRVIKQMQPGKSWVGSGRGVTYDYKASNYYWSYNVGQNAYALTGGFPKWTITADANALPTVAGYYGDGELYLTVITDEDGKSAIEAKDKRGLVVMTMEGVSLSQQGQMRPMDYAYTFYVYDDLGNKRCVIPPLATTRTATDANGSISWGLSLDQMNGYCYTYLYDGRNRLIEKKLPGKELEYFVYDQRDRLIMHQDATMRHYNPSGDNSWQFTYYDALDRPTMSAICLGNSSRTTMQTWIDDNSVWPAPHWLYYFKNYDLLNVYPTAITGCTILNYNYYDDYSNISGLGLDFDATQFSSFTVPTSGSAAVPTLSTMTRGLATASKSLVINPDNSGTALWLIAANYYDDKGRMIQSQSQNANGGKDINSNIYYFQGDLYKSIVHHENPNAQPISGTTDNYQSRDIVTTITRNFGMGSGNALIKSITQKIGGGIEYPFADYSYDHLGRPVVKQFAGCNILNEYNIRGFLNHIDVVNTNNNINTPNHDPQLFEEHLYYDFGFSNKLYNSNITGITWKMSGGGSPWQSYGYSYDSLNRLTHAEYRRSDEDAQAAWIKTQYDYTTSNIKYDLNGNIMSMHQRGIDLATSSTPIDMDALGYVYAPNSNQLIKVEDTVAVSQTPSLPDFKNNANLAIEYTYDGDGDLISDANKGIGSITYNFLHKAAIINVPGKGEVRYWYDEAGNRIRKTMHYLDGSGNPDEKWDYFGSFVYKNDTLQYILNDEGRARPVPLYVDENNTVTKFIYDYFVKDHLGNVRSTVTAEPFNPSYLAAYEIGQANTEQLVFDNIANVRDLKPGSTDPGDVMAARLNGSDAKTRIGTSILLEAMPGDRFQVSVDAYYEGEYKTDQVVSGDDVVAALSATLMGGTDYSGVPMSELPQNIKTIETIFRNPDLAGQIYDLTSANDVITAPKAHLNYVFFDEKMNLVSDASGATQVYINSATAAPGFVHLGNITCNVCQGQWFIAPSHGYFLVYIDNQSIGKDVWFDNLMIGHYSGTVVEENHYYPHGLTLNTFQNHAVPTNTKKYQSIELEKHFGLETYETLNRGLDPQLGRFNSIDPKSEKHFNFTPYVSMGDNPVKNVDPLGDDWFVNNTDGQVVYLKNVSEVDGMAFIKAGFNGPVSQYERLGSNNMFGNEVIDSKGNNMLENNVFVLGNSEAFMQGKGYAKAENVEIEEKEFTSRGSMGEGERVTQVNGSLEQIGDSKVTYVKPQELNKKVIEEKDASSSTFSSIKSILYKLTKPFGQSNEATAVYSSNRSIFGISAENKSEIKTGGSVMGQIYKIIKPFLKK